MQNTNQFNPKLTRLATFSTIILCLILIALIGFLDRITGYEISFSIFYLIPIYIASWYVNFRISLFITILSGITWLTIDITSGHHYSSSIIPLWNAIVRFGFFLITSTILTKLKFHIEHEKNLSRIDSLTGVMNKRAFDEEAQKFFNLSARYKHPFTLMYMDLDNFKTVNDTFGHNEGDRLLKIIAETLINSVRDNDFIARLGGDEFVIFLPLTGQQDAQKFISRIHHKLLELVNQNAWHISFSIGVVTFSIPTTTVDEAIKLTDQVMYQVKNSGKNNIAYEIWNGENMSSDYSLQRTVNHH